MMFFKQSFQEQRFLSSVRLEKDAFESLIKTKAHVAIPVDQDGRSGLRQQQMQENCLAHKYMATASTRKAGGVVERVAPPMVLVDLREFRSSLPSMLHESGMLLEPITLLVGDYILSPNM